MSAVGVAAPKRPPRFFSLPSTTFGTWSGWLLIVALVATLVLNLARSAGLPQIVANAAGLSLFLSALATGVTALVAIARERERSWTAFLAVIAMLFVVAMNFGPLLFGE